MRCHVTKTAWALNLDQCPRGTGRDQHDESAGQQPFAFRITSYNVCYTKLLRAVPVGRLYRWNRLGARIIPDHTYRVTVEYDNPTGDMLPQGGMGVIGGLMVPENPDAWPAADVSDSLYLSDLRHYLRLPPDAAPPGEAAAEHHHAH